MGNRVFQNHLLGQEHDVSRTSSLVIIINISLHALSCWPAKTLRGGTDLTFSSKVQELHGRLGTRMVSRDGYSYDTIGPVI